MTFLITPKSLYNSAFFLQDQILVSRHIAFTSLSILHRSSAVYRFVVSFKQKICQGKILPGIKSYFKNDLIYSSSAVPYKPPPAVFDHIKLLLIMLNHHIVTSEAH